MEIGDFKWEDNNPGPEEKRRDRRRNGLKMKISVLFFFRWDHSFTSTENCVLAVVLLQ